MEPIRKEAGVEQSKFFVQISVCSIKNYSREPKKKKELVFPWSQFISFLKKRTGRKSSDACLILMESKCVPHPLKTLIKATSLFFNDGPINLPVSMKVTVIYSRF